MIELRRGYTDLGTFGKFYIDGTFVCYSVERPWEDNKPFRSCIPEGEYLLVKHESPKYGDCLAVLGGTVSIHEEDGGSRYAILLHAANWPEQLMGCIAPVASLGVLPQKPDKWAGAHSANALRRLESKVYAAMGLKDQIEFKITHVEAW